MAAYAIVLSGEEGLATVYTDDIAKFADDMCAEITGVETNPRRRAELQGQPQISGFVGPCWGGLTDTGEPIIRYEDIAAYNALSI